MEIKTMLIVAAVACCAVALITGTLTYKYTSQHYELQISNEHLKQQTELANLNAKVVEKERENNEITSKLENQAIANKDKVDLLKASIAQYRSANGSLSIRASSCNSNAGIASGTATSTATGSSTAPEGVCQLHGEFAEILTKTFNDADTMRDNLLICQEYAKAIDKQRKEMYNSKD